ncbi:hypothetical protein M407DRAFT_23131 [Tulasnella calospora MUT 4182]|uniref:Chromo domain-containing protein n=1 Tax=Tulasnella calospora MUT 4182 TaxID=1051891 RepID=A0A0C3L1I6_9AGAM|nr:hypothetical protein M407DRAFT_23131 [Tulasnella calospora MUT 4182]
MVYLKPAIHPGTIPDRAAPPDPPLSIDEDESTAFKIIGILNSRSIRKRVDYFVAYRNQPISKHSWIRYKDLPVSSHSLLCMFHSQYPNKPCPRKLPDDFNQHELEPASNPSFAPPEPHHTRSSKVTPPDTVPVHLLSYHPPELNFTHRGHMSDRSEARLLLFGNIGISHGSQSEVGGTLHWLGAPDQSPSVYHKLVAGTSCRPRKPSSDLRWSYHHCEKTFKAVKTVSCVIPAVGDFVGVAAKVGLAFIDTIETMDQNEAVSKELAAHTSKLSTYQGYVEKKSDVDSGDDLVNHINNLHRHVGHCLAGDRDLWNSSGRPKKVFLASDHGNELKGYQDTIQNALEEMQIPVSLKNADIVVSSHHKGLLLPALLKSLPTNLVSTTSKIGISRQPTIFESPDCDAPRLRIPRLVFPHNSSAKGHGHKRAILTLLEDTKWPLPVDDAVQNLLHTIAELPDLPPDIIPFKDTAEALEATRARVEKASQKYGKRERGLWGGIMIKYKFSSLRPGKCTKILRARNGDTGKITATLRTHLDSIEVPDSTLRSLGGTEAPSGPQNHPAVPPVQAEGPLESSISPPGPKSKSEKHLVGSDHPTSHPASVTNSSPEPPADQQDRVPIHGIHGSAEMPSGPQTHSTVPSVQAERANLVTHINNIHMELGTVQKKVTLWNSSGRLKKAFLAGDHADELKGYQDTIHNVLEEMQPLVSLKTADVVIELKKSELRVERRRLLNCLGNGSYGARGSSIEDVTCLPSTRVGILGRISEWIKGGSKTGSRRDPIRDWDRDFGRGVTEEV